MHSASFFSAPHGVIVFAIRSDGGSYFTDLLWKELLRVCSEGAGAFMPLNKGSEEIRLQARALINARAKAISLQA